MKPLCFVLMPFGTKYDGNKKEINFDTVYESFIKPAIIEAGLEPIRADEEKSGGFIHKPMFERLLFCKFAVADLSFANANVFYELGIRHAVKSYTTVSIFETSTRLPFDTAPLRTMPYDFEEGAVKNVKQQIQDLANAIKINLTAQRAQEDSPIAQLITNYKFPDLNYLQQDADSFTEWVTKTNALKNELAALVEEWKKLKKAEDAEKDIIQKEKHAQARQEIVSKLKQLETDASAGLKFDFDLLYSFLDAYKSTNAFKELTSLLKPIVDTTAKGNIYLQQQLALAYNKIKERDAAETILTEIIEHYGPDPETNGLLGAVYKGMMDDHEKDDDMHKECCTHAIATYLAGFEADPRDYYPGVNALTLMFMHDATDENYNKYFPLVKYAVERQLEPKKKDYWVQATALEVAVLEMDRARAKKQLASALFCKPAFWMKDSTVNNLERIYNKATETNTEADMKWLLDIILKLKE